MEIRIIFLALVQFVFPANAEITSYKNAKLVKIEIHSEQQRFVLTEAASFLHDKVVFSDFPGKTQSSIDAVVPEGNWGWFEDYVLGANRFLYSVKHHDVEEMLEAEKKNCSTTRMPGFEKEDFPLNICHPFNEIAAHLVYLSKTYSKVCSLMSIGKSYEGRDQWVLKVSTKKSPGRKAFWIDATTHAREWEGTASLIYFLTTALTQYGKDPAITKIVDLVDWYFLPVLNPDGYDYTWTTNRLWRKNRQNNTKSSCIGTDLNRNFDFHWGVSGGGIVSSHDPCSEVFVGSKACSAPECMNVANALSSLGELYGYMNIHTATEPGSWFYPYSNHTHTYPPDVKQLSDVAMKAVAAIKADHGKVYKVGSPADILYAVTGDIMSWAKLTTKIKYTYGMELYAAGFTFNSTQIVPTGQDLLMAFATVAQGISMG